MLDEFVHVALHQLLNEIDVLHLLEGMRADDVLNVDDILVFESGENLHFAQRPLAEALVLEGRELLDRHALAGETIVPGDDHAVRSFANVLQIGVARTDFEQLIFDQFTPSRRCMAVEWLSRVFIVVFRRDRQSGGDARRRRGRRRGGSDIHRRAKGKK